MFDPSLLLKILAALSVLAAIVTLFFDMREKSMGQLSRTQSRMLVVGLLGGSVVLGAVDYYTSRMPEPQVAASTTTTYGPTNITGDGNAVINSSAPISSVNIQTGPSAEEMERRVRQARSVIVSSIVNNIVAIDQRLDYVYRILGPESKQGQEAQAEMVATVAPTAAALNMLHNEMADYSVTADYLRQTVNSKPLDLSFAQSLGQDLVESNIDPDGVHAFYQELAEVQYATESLFSAFEGVLKDQPGGDSPKLDNSKRRLAIAVERLTIASNLAYYRAMPILTAAGDLSVAIDGALGRLLHLPPRLLDAHEALVKLQELTRSYADLVQREAAMAAESEHLHMLAAQELETELHKLEIQPSDSWEEVVSKARSLRELGMIGEAAAAYAAYGRMFKDTDPTAAQFAETAIAFTTQMQALGVQGGVYIYSVLDGEAKKAGIQVGDVIIDYGGVATADVTIMADLIAKSHSDDLVRVTYLRWQPETGEFMRYTAVVPGSRMGAGYMPI